MLPDDPKLNENIVRDFRRGANNFVRSLKGDEPVDYAAQDQTKMDQSQAQIMRDDPNVKEEKFKKFSSELKKQFNKLAPMQAPNTQQQPTMPGQPPVQPPAAPPNQAKNRINAALDNIAKSMTYGNKIHAHDIDEIVMAVHVSSSVPEEVKGHTLSDHYRVMMFIRRVFESSREFWYNPDAHTAEEKLPPGTVYNSAELDSYWKQWHKSPFRFKPQAPQQAAQMPDPNAAAAATGTPGAAPTPGAALSNAPKFQSGAELIDWLINTFSEEGVAPGGRMEKYPSIDLRFDQWKAMADSLARSSGIQLTPQDLTRLNDISILR